jgi:hypothetical protein
MWEKLRGIRRALERKQQPKGLAALPCCRRFPRTVSRSMSPRSPQTLRECPG